MMNRKALFLFIISSLLIFLSRILIFEKYQSHWDGPQYSIAIFNYSFIQETPAIPGYPLYIAIARFFNYIFLNPHFSILFVSGLYSVLGFWIFFLCGKKFFNRTVGVYSSILFITSPVFYYFGITANPYGAVGVNSLILALATFLLSKKTKGIFYGFLFSYVIGFRPQELLFLLPLYIYGLSLLNAKQRVISLIGFIFLTLFWIFPTSKNIGGIFEYFRLMIGSYSSSAENISIGKRIIYILPIIVKGLYLGLGVSGVFLAFIIIRKIREFNEKILTNKVNRTTIIFLLWIFPSLIYNVLVRSDHAAHQVDYLAALILLAGLSIDYVFKNKSLSKLALVLLGLINLITFFWDRDPNFQKKYIPQSYHYSEIKKNNIVMDLKIRFIKNHGQQNDTVIFTNADNWRPYMYHLEKYVVYNLDGLYSKDKKFKCIQRKANNYRFILAYNCELTLKIPVNVRRIILVDPVRSAIGKIVSLPYNQKIQIIELKGGSEIYYEYGKIFKNK